VDVRLNFLGVLLQMRLGPLPRSLVKKADMFVSLSSPLLLVVAFDEGLLKRLDLLLDLFLLLFFLPQKQEPSLESALLLVDHLDELFGLDI
jgi:hypothetical protein